MVYVKDEWTMDNKEKVYEAQTFRKRVDEALREEVRKKKEAKGTIWTCANILTRHKAMEGYRRRRKVFAEI